MKYRRFGKTNIDVSVLGFGMMRLPLNSDDPTDINEELAIDLVRKGIDQGINYIDTAYVYHRGKSEEITAKALADGYRDKVHLATKLPSWDVQTQEDMFKYFEEQLIKLKTETIDFYLIHYLNRGFWDIFIKNGLFEFLDTIKKDGRAKFVGFSFHDDYDLFQEIIEAYDWDFCQIQLNYMDTDYQAGLKGLEYASKKGLGISIMEPLRGGSLAKNVPDDIMNIWKEVNPGKSPASWGFDYLYNFKEISVVLSGMNEMDHLIDNLKTAKNSMANKLSEQELVTIEDVKKQYKARIKVNCTACGYCLPCPSNVSIPDIFTLYNHSSVFNEIETYRQRYWRYFHNDKHANMCTECGACMNKCPQKINIIDELKGVVDMYGESYK